MANVLNPTRKFDTVEQAIRAGQREYSAAQNKLYHTAIYLEITPDGQVAMDTVPAGYPVVAGNMCKVVYNDGQKWVRDNAMIDLIEQERYNA